MTDGNETGNMGIFAAVLPQSEMPPWCDTCCAHIVPMTRWERLVSWAAYRLLDWPFWMPDRLYWAALPWSGKYAYTTQCKHLETT